MSWKSMWNQCKHLKLIEKWDKLLLSRKIYSQMCKERGPLSFQNFIENKKKKLYLKQMGVFLLAIWEKDFPRETFPYIQRFSMILTSPFWNYGYMCLPQCAESESSINR